MCYLVGKKNEFFFVRHHYNATHVGVVENRGYSRYFSVWAMRILFVRLVKSIRLSIRIVGIVSGRVLFVCTQCDERADRY